MRGLITFEIPHPSAGVNNRPFMSVLTIISDIALRPKHKKETILSVGFEMAINQ